MSPLVSKRIKQTKPCELCGKPFNRNRYYTDAVWDRARFCGNSCAVKSKPVTWKLESKNCLTCSVSFNRKYQYSNKQWSIAKYCSPECQYVGKRKSDKVRPRRFTSSDKKWRLAVLERDNYTCQVCGSNSRLEADHIKPHKFFPELRLELSNGRTLCRDCHKKTPTYGGNIRKYFSEGWVRDFEDVSL